MGHETIGRVIEAPSDTSRSVGDRVAVNPVVACGTCTYCAAAEENLCTNRRLYGCHPALDGGLADELIVRAENCTRIDPEANLRGLALIEPMAVGTHAARIGRVSEDTSALIIGGGPIGLACALAATSAKATVTVCEPQQRRQDAAAALGLNTCSPDEIESRTTYEVVFECVGLAETVRAAITNVRPGGTVICVGVADTDISVPSTPLVIQERRLLGSSAYTARDFHATARWVTAKADELARLVEQTASLQHMPRIFRDYETHRETAMKTLFVPDERL